MLKPPTSNLSNWTNSQPPSGGCVLKQALMAHPLGAVVPAAFGRLCVETIFFVLIFLIAQTQPPSGGCVLKPLGLGRMSSYQCQPPSGGCVLKHLILYA